MLDPGVGLTFSAAEEALRDNEMNRNWKTLFIFDVVNFKSCT